MLDQCQNRFELIFVIDKVELELLGHLVNVCKYFKRGYKEGRTRLFSVVPSDRTRGNGHNVTHRRFLLSIRKHFFTVRVTEHWHRLPREVVESPSFEIFVIWTWSWMTDSRWSCLSRGVGPDDQKMSLPTSTIL